MKKLHRSNKQGYLPYDFSHSWSLKRFNNIFIGTNVLILCIISMLVPNSAYSITASPIPVSVQQPDGSRIMVFLKGDEYFHWNEDETGYAIVKSHDKKWWMYALEDNGRLAPTNYVAGRVDPASVGLVKPDILKLKNDAPRLMAPGSQRDQEVFKAPPTGTMYNLVLLVDFTDLTVTNSRQDFDDLFNQIGYSADGAAGSVRDYYDEVSYNNLSVVSTVVEPVTISHGYAYYGANDAYGYDIRPREMVQEALAALEARGFDFSTMDSDGDGWVDGLTVIHAGGGEEYSGNDPDYIWSHAWALSSTVIYDGVRMRNYHTEPARRGYDSDPGSWGITRIGVICHENGHFIGLPDLYDYGYDSQGAGRFCLMAGGSWNGSGTKPAHMSAWCKVDLGWVTPTLITSGGGYSLPQVETVAQICKLQGGFPGNEYFLAENRQGVGFDAALPGSNRGILIWHVDENQPNNNDQTHYKVDLEEASGIQHLELNMNSGQDSDYYRFGNYTSFTSNTTPNNLSYSGDPLGLDIFDVGATGVFMSFTVSEFLVTLASPNGGETVPAGQEYEIAWTVDGGAPDSVSIFLSIDSGESYDDTVVTGYTGGSPYDWTVPELPVNTARLKLVAYRGGEIGFDMSDGDFTIQGKPYRYVSPAGGNMHPYSIPDWAALDIQDAIDAADPGDSIMVAGATYNSAVTVDNPVYLLGGWDLGFSSWDPETNVTTIQGLGSIVSFMNNNPDPCGIEGFTITGGTGTITFLPGNGSYGGGIFSYNSSPVIRNNKITGCGYANTTDFSAGGGIACSGGDAIIEDNEITGGIAQSGGGIYLYQVGAVIRNNRISGSTPEAGYMGLKSGGGIYALHSTVTMEGNVIEGNDGYSEGGGYCARFSPSTLTGDSISSNDCLASGGGIYGERSSLVVSGGYIGLNTCPGSGGGISHKYGSLDIGNSVVALNEAGVIGGGIYADSTWGGVVNNTIDRNGASAGGGNVFLATVVSMDVRNNLVTYGSANGFQANSLDNLTLQYNNCFGNLPEDVATVIPDTTNTSRAPHYADTTAMDYHLLVHSGGIDAGDPSGSSDPDGSRADQGAFGGPDAVMAAPEYVKSLTALAVSDTTIRLEWDQLPPGDLSYYAVYGDTSDGFVPDESLFIGNIPEPGDAFLHHPVGGCWYYRVSGVNTSGYGGGYSGQGSACAAGPDTTAPVVAVVYPNGGEVFDYGDTLDIQWVATDGRSVDSVSVYYSLSGGADFSLIAHGEPNDSLYRWIAPSMSSDSCLVKVVAYDPGLLAGEDVSDSLFSIKNLTDVDDTPYANLLEQNYPNPFNPSTRIVFSIREAGSVSLKIYDTSGRLVRVLVDGRREAGRYEEVWDGRGKSGRSVASGVYFYRLVAGAFINTKKMVLLR